jgi:hypothetical protein
MAKLLKPTNDPSLLKETHSGRSTTIKEKLRKLFEPTDFVRVINPDTEAFVWQWLPPQKEDITFTDGTVPMKITHRGDPEIWKLDAGQSGTIVGANAYVMMDGLIKRMMAKKVIARDPNVKPGQARNFNFSDDVAQQEWINVIFLGLDNPFETEGFKVATTPTKTDLDEQIDEDLGLNAKRDIQDKASRTVPKPGERASEAIQAALS